MSPYRISLVVFALTMGAFFLALSGLCHSGRMPGPRISDSVSFNQKALWLRKYFEQHPSAEIEIVGSSMGLDNIDGEELAKSRGTPLILNASSWGLDVTESARMVHLLVEEASTAPRLVIIPVFFGDFLKHQEKNLNWSDLRQFLSSPFLVPLYLEYPDYGYYLETYRTQGAPKAMARQVVDSLHFDAFGGVPLSCDSFEYRKERWDMYRTAEIGHAEWEPAAIPNLIDLASYLEAKKPG